MKKYSFHAWSKNNREYQYNMYTIAKDHVKFLHTSKRKNFAPFFYPWRVEYNIKIYLSILLF